MGVFDGSKKIVIGDVAHDAADSGAPLKLGGYAAATAPSAVSSGDRVNAWFDNYGRLVVNLAGVVAPGQQPKAASIPVVLPTDQSALSFTGAIAHDAVDTVNPLKIGGAASQNEGTAVTGGDLANVWVDLYGRVNVNLSMRKQVTMSPSTPVPSGSDITMTAGAAVVAGDLTIRDTSAHNFYIPVGIRGYRSCIIYLRNGTSNWDTAPTVTIYGAMDYSGSNPAAQLASFVLRTAASSRMAIGFSDVGLGGLGGLAAATPIPESYHYVAVPALADGWPYINVLIRSASSAPTTGEILTFDTFRMQV